MTAQKTVQNNAVWLQEGGCSSSILTGTCWAAPYTDSLWPGKHSAFTESTIWSLTIWGQMSAKSFSWHSSWLHYRLSCMPVSFIQTFTVSYFPFLRLVILRGLCQWQWQVCRWEENISLILCHSLMSWDSNIFARVFFTRRAVRRQAGLWAQHSDISFPICRRHWRHTSI